MFTGIIEEFGIVKKIEERVNQIELSIEVKWDDLQIGESVAVNGVCLTVVKFEDKVVLFYVSPETMKTSSLGSLNISHKLNLERALQVGARLSGHWVQGHVDGVGKIFRIKQEGESHKIIFTVDKRLGLYCVKKGSISVDGVSLTINDVRDLEDCSEIEVQIIPHTWDYTLFHLYNEGDKVNIEVDILAKYMERLCQR